MIDVQELKKLSIDKLLVKAISQGNGASRQEIMNRQFACKPQIPSLGEFLYGELNKIYGMVRAPDQEEESGGPDIEEIDLSDNPDPTCTMARRFKRDGFRGQNMRDSARAEAYISLAADNPKVESELPDSGKAFWKSAEFHHRLWKQLKNQEKAS